MARTRARIIDAVVGLHAERGARNTSYADIAARADVAVPTVYKHLPNLTALFDACVGHVSERAPPLGPDIFDGLTGADRIAALAKALAAQHRHYAPWLRWSVYEAPLIPQLAAHHRRMDEAHRALIAQAVAPAFKTAPPQALIGLLASLFEFRSWQALVTQYGLSEAAAADAIANAARLVFDSYAPSPTQRTTP